MKTIKCIALKKLYAVFSSSSKYGVNCKKAGLNTYSSKDSLDAASASFAIHKIFCLSKVSLRLTEVPTLVEATQAGIAASHLQHSLLYALLLTAQMFKKITAFATKKANNFEKI